MAVVQAEPDMASKFLQIAREVARKVSPTVGPCGHHRIKKIVRDDPCPFAHFFATLPSVNGREFIGRVRKLARRNGIAVRFDQTRGRAATAPCIVATAIPW